MADEDNSHAVKRLQKAGSITDIHLYRRQNISSSRLFGRNAQHLDATAWRYQKGAALPATTVFHEATGPAEPHGATIVVVTPHEKVLPETGSHQHRQAIEIPRSQLDDEIQRILSDAAEILRSGHPELRLEGYRHGQKTAVWAIAQRSTRPSPTDASRTRRRQRASRRTDRRSDSRIEYSRPVWRPAWTVRC